MQLVISDPHEGPKAGITRVIVRATWQRCRGHSIQNALAHAAKRDKPAVAVGLRGIFVR